ncbi:MAG: CRISPR-associated protein, partial [Cyanobacteria bacterium P01_F01_bin.143]
ILESRHSFDAGNTEIAEGLFRIYFGEENMHLIQRDNLWNKEERAGILGDRKQDQKTEAELFNNWMINLAKVGFHLFRNDTK